MTKSLIATALIVTSLVVATPRPAFALAPTEDATSLAVRADEAHDAGRISEAADLYVRVYRAMTAQEREALGEVIVAAALDDLRASFRSTADPAYAQTAGALLAEYERDTGRTLPDALVEHRAWIDGASANDEPAAAVVVDDPAPRRSEDADDEPSPTPRRREDAPTRDRELVGPILLGFGIAAVIGGAAAVGTGAPMARAAERSRSDAFADMRYLAMDPDARETIAYREGYDEYVRRATVRGRALVAIGSVLVASGIGVAIYGAVRLARHQSGRVRDREDRRGGDETARIRVIPGGFAF